MEGLRPKISQLWKPDPKLSAPIHVDIRVCQCSGKTMMVTVMTTVVTEIKKKKKQKRKIVKKKGDGEKLNFRVK